MYLRTKVVATCVAVASSSPCRASWHMMFVNPEWSLGVSLTAVTLLTTGVMAAVYGIIEIMSRRPNKEQ